MGHLRVMAGSNITCIGDFTHEDSFWPRNDAHIYGRRCERPLRSHRWELVQITTQTARQSPNQGVRNPPSQMTKSALSAGPRWPFGKRSTDFFRSKIKNAKIENFLQYPIYKPSAMSEAEAISWPNSETPSRHTSHSRYSNTGVCNQLSATPTHTKINNLAGLLHRRTWHT